MKKHWLIIPSILIFYFKSYGQDTKDSFLDEFNISINRTDLKNENTEDKFGFGLSIYHSWIKEKKINLTLGLEYNRTGQLKKRMYEGHFAHSTDVTYTLNNISIPFSLRFNIGNKTNLFFETGTFIDLIVSAKESGTIHSYLPDQNNNIVYKEDQFSGKANISSINYGFSFGLGIKIPVKKMELLIKPEYKLGLHELNSYQDNIYNRYIRLSVGIKKH